MLQKRFRVQYFSLLSQVLSTLLTIWSVIFRKLPKPNHLQKNYKPLLVSLTLKTPGQQKPIESNYIISEKILLKKLTPQLIQLIDFILNIHIIILLAIFIKKVIMYTQKKSWLCNLLFFCFFLYRGPGKKRGKRAWNC